MLFLEPLKLIEIGQFVLAYCHCLNWSSKFCSKKTNLHSLIYSLDSSSFCNSSSSSLKDWEVESWLGFQPFCHYQLLKKFAVLMKLRSSNFAASQQDNCANSWMVSSSDWLALLLSCLWLVDRSRLNYISACWSLHFSQQNKPQCPIKLL